MTEASRAKELEPKHRELTQAFSTTGLITASIGEVIEIAQMAGANVELGLSQAIYEEVKEKGLDKWGRYVKDLTQKAGIKILCTHTGIQFNLAGFAPERLKLQAPPLKEQMLMTKALGVPLTLHPETFWGTDTEYGKDLIQEDLIKLVEETGADVSLELVLWRPPLDKEKDFYGIGEKRRKHPGITTRREILNFLAKIEETKPELLPHFGVTLDVGYVFRRPIELSKKGYTYLRRVYEGIQNLGKKHGIDSLIKVIHLYDASGWQEEAKGGLQTFPLKTRTLPLGVGELPVTKFVRFLKEKNFQGVVVHERMPQYMGEKIIPAAVRMGIYELSKLRLRLPRKSIAEAIKKEMGFVEEA